MTKAENLDYRNSGSTMPDWFGPTSTDSPLFMSLSSYDGVPITWRDYPNNTSNALNCSMKNVSSNRFNNARAKAKIVKKSRKRNRNK